MSPLRIIIMVAVVVLLLVIGRALSVPQGPDADAQAAEQQQLTSQLSHYCHLSWQQYEWTIGERRALARDNIAFSDGIKRICQARAELFFEGYDVSPFIDPDAQQKIFPIVFLPDQEELKSVIRQNLPALTII